MTTVSSGDVLRQLFRSFTNLDEAGFRSAAQEVIREERQKNHRLLADDLERILTNGARQSAKRRSPYLFEPPIDRERDVPLLDVREHDLAWSQLIVHPDAYDALMQIYDENRRRDLLAAASLRPTQKVLFHGPPGCGKTLAAKVLASQLSCPLVTVRFDAIVSSLLGATATNLRKVFDFVQTGRWVILFDEFDAIGKDRDNPTEHGELKRVVNALLQLMDDYTGESLLIAATNHVGLLDSAVWRRFDAVIPFEPPTQQERHLLLRLFLRGFDLADADLASLAKGLRGATGADIERVVVGATRRAVLAGRATPIKEDFAPAVSEFRKRQQLVSRLATASLRRGSKPKSGSKDTLEEAANTDGA